jgi:hypothetical protein
MAEELTLKWGSVKGWSGLSESSVELLKEYYNEGVPMSAMMDHPTEDRIEILCRLIDNIDGTIYNDWEGTEMTKDEAKEYVRNYRK